MVVLDLDEVDETQTATVGGKAASLGTLARIDGVRVPAGFCVTTEAFQQVVAPILAAAPPASQLRALIEEVTVPDEVAAEIAEALARLGAQDAYAVRSSATAEDTPTASFAGQYDSYLDVRGTAEVLRHVRRCWASLFTERALAYRRRHGLDHRSVAMAVIVQRMVRPDAAGVLFTADPVSGDRTVATVDAVPGLADDLVSGLAEPDRFRVRDGRVLAAVRRPGRPALTDAQVVELVALGRRVEAHFGRPQDVEWCLSGDGFQLVQSRPVTTLFPVPAAARDGGNHVYLSVGHQQMMTDAMKPLGWSMWQRTAMAVMHEAGGRLFVDATPILGAPARRAGFLAMTGRADPLLRDALQTLLDRPGFVPELPDTGPGEAATGGPPEPIETDPAVVTGLIERSEASVAALRRDIAGRTGPELFDFLEEAFREHKRVLGDPVGMRVIMAGMEAAWWLDDRLEEWLGEPGASGTLTLSAPGNVTAEMGLALLDVADVVRTSPEVVDLLRTAGDDFLDELPKVPGGSEARDAIEHYLDRYGMRCAGEIDITRPRWREEPATLVPVILDHVRNAAPGEARRRFERGRQAAGDKAREVLDRLRQLPDGAAKAAETERMIERVRTFVGYREYPKYGIVSRYLIYKQALLAEAGRLVRAGVLAERDDAFYLTVDEFREAARTGEVDGGLIERRRDEFRWHQTLPSPRVLTSDGEVLTGAYRRDDLPPGALAGTPVSAGVVEGRARVVTDLADAELEPGDILVTAHTDPSWTPVFVAVAGLVTEVGAVMTHGAVIAREYGLPAVVSVVGATRLIADGQRIRVNGSDGYVELLP